MQDLKDASDPKTLDGMARFGIRTEKALGISVPKLRKIAREIGKDHGLAEQLWISGVHEARILACMVDSPSSVTESQMGKWVQEFDSWDICDGCCGNLFVHTNYAYQKAVEWAGRKEEFVKRAGFAMMAELAIHDKKSPDDLFLKFLPLIQREANDKRNFVKKGVNWALRQIGKRNAFLSKKTIETAREIRSQDSASARWIASDALRELTGDSVQKRLKKNGKKLE